MSMFPLPLRHSRSERSLRKLKKGKSFSWATKQAKTAPKVDFSAFRSGLPADQHVHAPVQRTTSARRVPRTAARNIKRDTILLDLSNNDLIPALDYAFAILDDDEVSIRSLPAPPPPRMPNLSRGSSTDSGDALHTPSASTFSAPYAMNPSIRSSPPRYTYVSSPLSSSPSSSAMPSARPSTQKRSSTRSAMSHHPTVSFDPHELSLALEEARATTPDLLPSPSSERSVPFPPPAERPTRRVPLLLRKPRVHSAESSIDGHESLGCRSYPGSSKVSLAPRSVSSLGHHHDVFGTRSSISLHNPDSALSALLAQQPSRTVTRSSYGSLRLFSKSRRTPTRRASTPPPSRVRLGIPVARPPVPALPDVFLLGPAARREASSESTSSLLSRAVRAANAM